jgi:hypothetical protein
MKIVVLHRPGNAADYHRITLPFRYLDLLNKERIHYIEENTQVRASEFKHADLVIFNRHPHLELDHLLVLKDKYKFKIWVDIDDYWELYKEHYLYNDWTKKKVKEKIIKALANADIVTVTNGRLLRAVRPINEKVIIIPNAVPVGYGQFMPKRVESTRTRFIYAGGPSHLNDLRTVESYFIRLINDRHFAKYGEWVHAGYNDKLREQSLHEMNKIIGLAPVSSSLNPLPIETYMGHYNHGDVSFAPLVKNEFNEMKSNLKIIEAGCMRMPIICSNMYPFLEDKEMNGMGVYYFDTPEQLYIICRNLIDKKSDYLERMGSNLYEYVYQKYNLLKVNKIRREIINSFK